MHSNLGRVDMAFLGMECAGAPLTWLYQGLLTKPVSKKMSDSRTLSGSNAEQAAAIITELGANDLQLRGLQEGREVESGSGEEALDEAGLVLHAPEPGLGEGGELGEVAFGEVG